MLTLLDPFLSSRVFVPLLMLLIAGCDWNTENHVKSDPVLYSIQEPGLAVVPTNVSSYKLMKKDGPARFSDLRYVIVESGNPCVKVTRAVLKGGLDGTDEWRVTCTDSGAWAVWFKPAYHVDIAHCSDTKC